MPKTDEKYGAMPFDEAVAFFRDKLSIGTEHWDDIWAAQHANAFMIAGAMDADLIVDLRTAVEAAIVEGETLAGFRKRFDAIVERTGWIYKGGRNWRTRVIYDTNLRTAYQAGRYQQMIDPDVVALRPFWQYRHGGSPNPRPEHLALNGKVFAYDDPFWNTHYPPNGWGCRCYVVTLSKRDLAKAGKTAPDKAPEIKYYDYTNKRTGKTIQVPVGIDPGFDYNVGQAAGRTRDMLAENLKNAEKEIKN